MTANPSSAAQAGTERFKVLLAEGKKHLRADASALAVAPLEEACALAPQSFEALGCLGVAYLNTGQYALAESVLSKSIALSPTVESHFNLGLVYINVRRFEDAAKQLTRAIEIRDDNPQTWRYLAQAYLHMGKMIHAVLILHKLAKENPESPYYRSLLVSVLKDFAPVKYETLYREAMLMCLADERQTLNDLNSFFVKLVSLAPDFKLVKAGMEAADYAAFKAAVDAHGTADFRDELLLRALSTFIICNPAFERALGYMRRTMLDMAARSETDAAKHLPFLSAIAQQCWLNEYVFAETPEETEAVGALCARLAGRGAWSPETAATVLAIAAYRPLAKVTETEALFTPAMIAEAKKFNAALGRVLAEQIEDPRAEAEIKKSVPQLCEMSDETSKLVRAMYEENPYPRWKSVYSPGGTLNVAVDLRPLRAKAAGGRLKSLIAGCGTGRHVLQTQANFPNTDITAIDLSFSSLAFAIKRTRENGLPDVRFMQADILDLEKMNETFDIIESVGVLHHMRDPLAGWKVLAHMLKPGGYMRIGLYSELGRQEVVACRNFIAENGFPATLQGIRACRAAIAQLPAGHIARQIEASPDYYSASLCRDLIFHVQEHRFTIPQIKDCLAETGLSFVAFDTTATRARREYDALHPEDPLHTNIDAWDEYERLHNPHAFRGMYQFWCQKPEG